MFEQRVDLGEPLVDPLAEVGVALVEDRPHRRHRGLRAVDVGLEVPQVGVAEDVLFAGDLARRDLVEQTLCAAGDLGRVDRERPAPSRLVSSSLHVGDQLVGDRVGVGLQPRHPQVLLQPVEAGPLLAGLEVGLAEVDAGVEVVGERLGDRLDALVIGTGDRELRLGRVDVAGLDRGDERSASAATSASIWLFTYRL